MQQRKNLLRCRNSDQKPLEHQTRKLADIPLHNRPEKDGKLFVALKNACF
jgi:hypothetical protein